MKKALGIALGVSLAFLGTVALASRDGSGNYSLYTPGNPVVTQTTISSSWANNTLNDIKTELTNSLDRNGRGGMLQPLRLTNGSVGSPSLSFSNDTSSGFYLTASGSHAMNLSLNGVDAFKWTTAGSTIVGGLVVGSGFTGTNAGNYAVSSLQRYLSIAPAPDVPLKYPLGHDIWVMPRGSADLHLDDWAVVLQSSDAITAGAARDIDVTAATAKVCPGGGTQNCENLAGYTSNLCPATYGGANLCSLWIEFESPTNVELLTPACTGGNACWSVVDENHIHVTTNKNHSGTYKIYQIGSLELGQRVIGLNRNSVSDSPVLLLDKRNYPTMQWTNDAAGTWPTASAAQFLYPISGGQVKNYGTSTVAANTNGDLTVRNYGTDSCLYHKDYGNVTTLMSVCPSAAASPQVYGGNNYTTTTWVMQNRNTTGSVTNAAYKVFGGGDATRVYGGGAAVASGGTANDTGALIFYPNQLGSDHNGQFQFHNNGEDIDFFLINTANGGSFSMKGNVAIQATGNYTHGGVSAAGNPGNLTVAGTAAVTGATTLSSTLGVTGNTTVGGTLGVTGDTTVTKLKCNGASCGGTRQMSSVTNAHGQDAALNVGTDCRPICSVKYDSGGSPLGCAVSCFVTGGGALTIDTYGAAGAGCDTVYVNYFCF